MKLSKLATAAILLAAIFLPSLCSADANQWHFYVHKSEEIKINNVIANRYVPYIKNATVSPEKPKSGEPINITAETAMDPLEKDNITGVYIHYTADLGTTWKQIMMKNEGAGLWTAALPGQRFGTALTYGFRITTDSGNMYVEAVCEQEDIPSLNKDYIANDCKNKNYFALCEEKLPRDCMFPMAADASPLNDGPASIPDGLDAWEYRVGYNVNSVFIDYAFEGDAATDSEILRQIVPRKRFNPMAMPENSSTFGARPFTGKESLAYRQVGDRMFLDNGTGSLFIAAGFILPDNLKCGEGVFSILCGGGFIGYMPQDRNPCGLDVLQYNQVNNIPAAVKCLSTNNHLSFKMDRMALKQRTDELYLVNIISAVVDSARARQYNYGSVSAVEYGTISQGGTGVACTTVSLPPFGNMRICAPAAPAPLRYGVISNQTLINENYVENVYGKVYEVSGFTRVRFSPRVLIIF